MDLRPATPDRGPLWPRPRGRPAEKIRSTLAFSAQGAYSKNRQPSRHPASIASGETVIRNALPARYVRTYARPDRGSSSESKDQMKYRHHGYRDDEYRRERERPTEQRNEKRGPREITTREATVVMRCWQCGTHQEPEAGSAPLASCSQCKADLHCCRNCHHFDPGARFQCRKPVEKAFRDKTVRNSCAEFEPRPVLDATGRRAGSPPGTQRTEPGPADPRDAFHNLFK